MYKKSFITMGIPSALPAALWLVWSIWTYHWKGLEIVKFSYILDVPKQVLGK